MAKRLLPLGCRVEVNSNLFSNLTGTIIGIDKSAVLDCPYIVHFDNERFNLHRGEGYNVIWFNDSKELGTWVHREHIKKIGETK